MIIGIGIDTVKVERFEPWVLYPKEKLLKVFSESEIEYSLSLPKKAPERLAARFAAKEAFLKAAHNLLHGTESNSFLKVCKQVEIVRKKCGKPELKVDWQGLSIDGENVSCLISLSHTADIASAIILLEAL